MFNYSQAQESAMFNLCIPCLLEFNLFELWLWHHIIQRQYTFFYEKPLYKQPSTRQPEV